MWFILKIRFGKKDNFRIIAIKYVYNLRVNWRKFFGGILREHMRNNLINYDCISSNERLIVFPKFELFQ